MFGKAIVNAGLLVGLANALPAKSSGTSVCTEYVDGQPQCSGASTYAASSLASASNSVLTSGSAPSTTATAATTAAASGSAAANQVGDVPGYTDANAPFASYTPEPTTATPTYFGTDSVISAIQTSAPPPGAPGAADTQRTSLPTGFTSHGPYSGKPTTTGAVANSPINPSTIPALPPNPTATYYNTNGLLTEPEAAPYAPHGGLGTNGTLPRYMVESDFDYESITLGLYQEWIELDTFNNGVATFSVEDFAAAGMSEEDISLIQFMAQQEQGHATLLSNMLGETAPPQCTYNYPYTNVREFVDFNQKLTKWGESGVWGFINHLDSREVGQLLAQSIATEARQQMIFRQFSGLHPMPVWFETGIPQSWAWTFLAPYISSCPENTTRLAWQNFPALHVVNQANINRISPNDTADWEYVGNRTSDPAITDLPQGEDCMYTNKTGYSCTPAITHNRSEPLSFPGKKVNLLWDAPGQPVGPNMSYITASGAGAPKFVAWAAELNLTYTPLTVTGANTGYTYQPATEVYQTKGAVNGTAFFAITDTNMPLTPFNLSMINPHIVALGLYQAG